MSAAKQEIERRMREAQKRVREAQEDEEQAKEELLQARAREEMDAVSDDAVGSHPGHEGLAVRVEQAEKAIDKLPSKSWVRQEVLGRILLPLVALAALLLGAAANWLAAILRFLGYLPFPSATPC